MGYTLVLFNTSNDMDFLNRAPQGTRMALLTLEQPIKSVHVYNLDTIHDYQQLKISINDWSEKESFDYCLLNASQRLAFPRLVVFDMDSTLIPFEVIDELADVAGVKTQVAKVTEAAMQGELDFNDSLRQRVSTLAGMSTESIEQVKQKLYFNPGIEQLCNYLIDEGCQVAIASGGFLPFAQHLSQTIPFTFLAANSLEFANSGLTGKVDGAIVNAAVKAEKLMLWRDQLGALPEEVLAVGDGANDLMMMQAAAFGVAYKAKPAVNEKAECVLRVGEADSLITLLEVVKQLSTKS